jgi:multidrug efflux pump subunit AcrA (membrane-fusion protein)
VDLLPEDEPPFFRSGMNATVDFRTESKENALLIPVEAVHKAGNENYVLLKQEGSKEPVKRVVELGMTDDKNFEVLSGVSANDKIIVKAKKYVLPNGNVGTNPFSPMGQQKKKSS